MCQQWLSVAGLAADIVGFLIIAWEWYRGFTHSVHIRNLQVDDAYERNLARDQGREPVFAMQEEEETMAREFSKLHNGSRIQAFSVCDWFCPSCSGICSASRRELAAGRSDIRL
jgi:hypothetical protein